MKPQSAKAKGRELQKFWRDRLISLLSDYGIINEDIKSTSMGAGGEDVQLSPAARKLIPISSECKSYSKIVVYNWYKQAKSNCNSYEPVLIIKANREKPLVVVDADHYLDLWEHKLRNENSK